MSDSELIRVIEEVEYLLARWQRRAQERPRLVVEHGYRRPGTICLPGESIERAYLQYLREEVPVHLSLPGLMVCDCMVRNHCTPLSIVRMERILTNELFYRRLGSNSSERTIELPMFTRVSLRVYVGRLREQIAKALKKRGSQIAIEEVFVSEPTDSNIVVHRIGLPAAINHRP